MINMPIESIREKIAAKTGLSNDEINNKIKAKLRQLSGLISEDGAAHIVANELGVKLFETGENVKIKDVLPGMRSVDFAAKVLQKYEVREFKTEKTEGKVGNILVGDETGVLRVVMWHKQADIHPQIKEGDIIKIQGGYVKDNQGRNEVHLNERSRLILNPPNVMINVKPREQMAEAKPTMRKTISEIKDGDENVELLATIVQVFDLNFFEVCPQCKKRVRLREDGFACPTHNVVKPDFNYVLNVYLDDGSDNMRAVFWREQVNQLLGLEQNVIMNFKEDPTSFEPVKTDLLGNIIKVIGKANKNQNFDRIELVANKVFKNPNPEEELKKLEERAAMAPKREPTPVMNMPLPAKPKSSPQASSMPAIPASAKKSHAEDGLESLDIDSDLMDIDDL